MRSYGKFWEKSIEYSLWAIKSHGADLPYETTLASSAWEDEAIIITEEIWQGCCYSWFKVWLTTLVYNGAGEEGGYIHWWKGMVGGNSAWSQGSSLLGEFGISLNPNFIQSNQNVRGRVCRVQWTLSGLVLIRGGAFEGGWPDWSVIPPARPAQYEGYITRFDTFSSSTY